MKTIIFAVILFSSIITRAEVLSLASPDGKNTVQFRLNTNGVPEYSVTAGGTAIIDWSALGIVVKGSTDFENGLVFVNSSRDQRDFTYPIIAGKSKYARDYYNELIITLSPVSAPAKFLKIFFRAYNDAISFRYNVSVNSPGGDYYVIRENTSFRLSDNYTSWPARTDRFIQSFEGRYHKLDINHLNKVVDSTGITGRISNDSLIILPFTAEVNSNLYISIAQAEIDNYAGMFLRYKGDGNYLTTTLTPNPADKSYSSLCKAPFSTPWRVIMISNTPGGLIESNIIMNLNEPCNIDDVSWIKPGKSTWDWWALNTGFDPGFGFGMNDKTFKYFIDFAAKNNLQYITIDAGWYGVIDKLDESIKKNLTTPVQELHLEELVKYAAERNIGIIVWAVWYHVRDQMEDAFSYFNRIGIKGVKIDLADRDDQYIVNLYHKIAETAAKYKLLINFHGVYPPDGLNRTYPNLLTREGILGNEYAKWDPAYPNPDQNVVEPFTRMLAGAMDFTPGSMRNSKLANYKPNFTQPSTLGTRAQQLAMFVVYESELQFLCDSPPTYESSIGFDFLRNVPANWDSTIVLDGKIGEYIAIARKNGNNWYVGVMTNWQSRDIDLRFDFLDNTNYKAEVYSDTDENYSNCSIRNFNVTKNSVKSFHMAPGGGLAISLIK